MNEAYSIGIIGGADGPTTILVTGRFPWELLLIAGICIGVVIWYFKRKK